MRIVVADHHRQALWALRTMLEEESELEIVGEATGTEGLAILAKNTAADLILLDRKLPGCHIKELISDLHALEPRPIVIVVSSNLEDSRMMLKAGADAFVSKGDQPDWLPQNLRQYVKRSQYTIGSNENSPAP
jgi:two-component system nitrate/nitrite response regulator NarL